MLRPRFNWDCVTPGCCQFVGGTDDYDIYMGECHEKPYSPCILLVHEHGFDYEFSDQREFASFVELVATEDERPKLGAALTFVQCFFPTPVRVAMDKMARGEDLETSAPSPPDIFSPVDNNG